MPGEMLKGKVSPKAMGMNKLGSALGAASFIAASIPNKKKQACGIGEVGEDDLKVHVFFGLI